ncbi:MAG: GAF domain-containing protein, partial [Anaerolineales bacterium]|nr:GAF domain-containing protein [Anaerolineales bacterium]
DWLPILLFLLLTIFSMSFSIVLADGLASLLPLISIVMYMVLGLSTTGWVVYIAALVHGVVRWQFGDFLLLRRQPTHTRLISLTLWNAVSSAVCILTAGLVFEGVVYSLDELNGTVAYLFGLLLMVLVYFTLNHLFNAAFFYLFIPSSTRTYLSQLPILLLYEAVPVFFVPFVTIIYQELGWSYFLFFACILITFSLITHNLDRTRQQLVRRLQQLQSLQAVGQTLNSSLDLDVIMLKIYEQVRRLMPADTFYIALYDRDTDLVSFPVFFREGNQMDWPTRTLQRGLTEYVLNTKRPLLIRRHFDRTLQELDIEQIGIPVTCWLGAPIIIRDDVLGVISVQSLTKPDVFDESDQEVLVTIASQAALAIQNAGSFAAINRSLSQRVQELDSIFRTTQDGILLLSHSWQIVAVNRAFWRLVGWQPGEFGEQTILQCSLDGESLAERLGFTAVSLTTDCEYLQEQGEGAQIKTQIAMPQGNYLDRTLTPVFNRNQQVNGWLLVLHDVTEEVALAQLREEMMHMMVHDLRAPLSILLGSLELGREQVQQGYGDQILNLLDMAEKNGERMLHLINELLDIYKLENGKVPLRRETVSVGVLFSDVRRQFDLMLTELNLDLSVTIAKNLPVLLVDYDYMSRVLYNLLDNAVKFTPDNGRIHLWARLDETTDLSAVLLGVSDTGAGITAETKAQLFHKFKRGTVEGRRKGSGLGLAFCRLVAEAHGGQIWVESDGIPGQGSTFVLRLPLLSESVPMVGNW